MARVKELPKKKKLLITAKAGTLEVTWEELMHILADAQILLHEVNLERKEY